MNKRNFRMLIYVTMVFISALLSASCMENSMCSNHIEEVIYSSDKQYKIIKYLRGCGATTGTSVHFSILGSNDELTNSPGNIYIIKSEDKGTNMEWLENNKLTIKTSGVVKEYKKEYFWDNKITINYTIPPPK